MWLEGPEGTGLRGISKISHFEHIHSTRNAKRTGHQAAQEGIPRAGGVDHALQPRRGHLDGPALPFKKKTNKQTNSIFIEILL